MARLSPALSWGAIYCLAARVATRGLCLLWWVPWALGDDMLESPSGEADGPEEPSESDLSEVQPPTPIAELPGLEPYAPGGIESFVRPSDSDQARSSAPSIGEPFPDNPAFDMATVPVLQRRVAACLQEVDSEHAPRPFLPAGCPVVVHNPFAIAAQITLHTSVVGTPQILREVLNDFAYRRGWQPIVCVQPQPNSDAIHLMPAAADEGLAAVLLRSGEALYPRCMTRRMPATDYHSITRVDCVCRILQDASPGPPLTCGMETVSMRTWGRGDHLRPHQPCHPPLHPVRVVASVPGLPVLSFSAFSCASGPSPF